MEQQNIFTHILVPTDGSESSIRAGHLAIQLATTYNARLTLMYVVDSAIVEEIASAIRKSTDIMHQDMESKGLHYLDYLTRLARDKDLPTEQVIRHGIPHNEIANLAQELGVDLIVIGRVGCRRARCLLGSVAERVIEHAPCPVLVVSHNPARR
jgi:nucleotide-binding universal stress UspA family protein